MLLLSSVVSCAHIEEQANYSDFERESMSQLKTDLLEYNANFSCDAQTKSWSSFWKRLKITVAADLSGAFWGAILLPAFPEISVLAGVLSSIYSATYPNDYYIPNQSYWGVYDSFVGMTVIDSVEVVHNNIICQLYSESPTQFPNYTIAQLYNKVAGYVADQYDVNLSTVNRVHIQQIAMKAQEVVAESDDVEGLISGLQRYTNGYDEEIDIIHTYLSGVYHIGDNLQLQREYTRGFIENIKNSTVNAVIKNRLVSAVSVGGHSMVLWQESSVQ